MSEGGTLKTLCLTKIDNDPRWVDLVIVLDKIEYIKSYPYPNYPNTCYLGLANGTLLHIDVPLKQIRKIIDAHQRFPMKNFDTHCDLDE